MNWLQYWNTSTMSKIDLEVFIAEHIHRTEEMILSIDVNETIYTNTPSKPSSIQLLIENLGLINLTSEKSNHRQYMTTVQ